MLNGNTNEEKVFDYLKRKGLTACGICGLMGNLRAESGMNPKNLQNSYEKSIGMTDEQYTKAVDNDSYKNFAGDKAGYGIAQWTFSTRKRSLLDYAKSTKRSIGDLEMQLDYLMMELEKSYKPVFNTLLTAGTIRQASDAVLLQYEKPANKGTAVQNKRANYGVEYYNKFVKPIKSSAVSSPAVTGIVAGWVKGKVGGIEVNTSLESNSGNYSAKASRVVSYIVMHYTANSKDTAENNAKYFRKNVGTSAHFFVDEKSIYQSVAVNNIAWHCGTKGKYYSACRNDKSIGIEMCCSGNYTVSKTTQENAAQLCAYLCRVLGIKDVDKYVIRHYDVTRKKCPAQFVDDPAQWDAFRKKVKSLL